MAGGAGPQALRSRRSAGTVLTAVSHPATGAGPGRHVRRAGQRRGRQLGSDTRSTPLKGGDSSRVPGRRGDRVQGSHRRGARPGEDGDAVQPHPLRAASTKRRFGGHTCDHLGPGAPGPATRPIAPAT